MRKLIQKALKGKRYAKQKFMHLLVYPMRRRKIRNRVKREGFKIPKLIKQPIPHILILVVDALRKDHMSLYGYKRDTTPFLKSIVERTAIFTNAYSTSSWTYPAVASILTGLYPHNHRGVYIHEPNDFDAGMLPQPIPRNINFLPEILSHYGFVSLFYSTIAFAELVAGDRFQYVKINDLQAAEYVIQYYLNWLKKRRETYTFTYLHLSDTHAPLCIKEPYRSAFGEIKNLPHIEKWGKYRNVASTEDPDFREFRENRIKLYDAAIRYVDAQIRQLFQALSSLSLLDKILIIFTADHGEELWDHTELERKFFYDPRPGYGFSHGQHLFQETINVPLILFGPDIPTGFYHHPVSHIDIVPTILEYLGIENYKKYFHLDGQNLFISDPQRVLLSEATCYGYEKKAVIQGKWKLYVSKGDGRVWVFDLSQDPKEKNPKYLPDVIARLQAYLPKNVRITPLTREMDENLKKRLRALGYIE